MNLMSDNIFWAGVTGLLSVLIGGMISWYKIRSSKPAPVEAINIPSVLGRLDEDVEDLYARTDRLDDKVDGLGREISELRGSFNAIIRSVQ